MSSVKISRRGDWPGSPTTGLCRRGDWQSRLSDYLVAVARRPFKYGDLDCGLFVAGAIAAMTGVDVARDLRGYSSRREAFARIRGMCGRPTMAAAADHLAAQFGIREVPVAMAQRGDAVQLARGSKAKLGLVAMHGFEVLIPYHDGILRVPRSLAVRAWRI
jgi:hypothetical protein